ncbi:MAG TPA: lysylphosphatidylglycerol synthase transmembrane domain-containing protein [Gemmatimonadaceae bacterium]|nr:lysylphosphatidylglycerol synthase transmembrane domain-containing protein [Gemmatimonadaceae bacterium]
MARTAPTHQPVPTIPRPLLRILRWAFVLAVVGAALWALRGQLPHVLAVADGVHLRWGLVAIASAVVLLTYLVLIESWRQVLAALGGALGRADAMRIWFGSNLARWLPGAFWQLGAMTEMTRRRGVPVAVSTGSAMLVTVVNLFTGLAVSCVFALPVLRERFGARGWWIVGLGVAALALAPLIVPRLGAMAARVTGREITLPRFGARAVLIAALSTTAAWLAYGVAFWMMAHAVLPGDTRTLSGCIALYTLSYLTGLLNPAPAGIGAAEGAMVVLAPQLGVATQAEAAVLSIIVRLWRTLLEVAPGVIALLWSGRDANDETDQPSRGSRIP